MGSYGTGAAAKGPDPDLAKTSGFLTFWVISGLWDLQLRATWISTILVFQGGAIRNFCRWAGCRKADLLTLSLGQLWADSKMTGTELGPTLERLWADFGSTLG